MKLNFHGYSKIILELHNNEGEKLGWIIHACSRKKRAAFEDNKN